jgi:hypothetical protein
MVKEKIIHSPPDMHARWYCILHYSDLVQQAVKYSMYQFNAQRKFTATNKLLEFKIFTQNKLSAVKT